MALLWVQTARVYFWQPESVDCWCGVRRWQGCHGCQNQVCYLYSRLLCIIWPKIQVERKCVLCHRSRIVGVSCILRIRQDIHWVQTVWVRLAPKKEGVSFAMVGCGSEIPQECFQFKFMMSQQQSKCSTWVGKLVHYKFIFSIVLNIKNHKLRQINNLNQCQIRIARPASYWAYVRRRILSSGNRSGQPNTVQSWRRKTRPPQPCCPTDTSPVDRTTVSMGSRILCQSRTLATPLMHSGRAVLRGGCTLPQSGQRACSTQPWSACIQSLWSPVLWEQNRKHRQQHSRLCLHTGNIDSGWPVHQRWCRLQSPEQLWEGRTLWPYNPSQSGQVLLCTRPLPPRRPESPGWSRRWRQCGNFWHHSQRKGTRIAQRTEGKQQRPSHTCRRRKEKLYEFIKSEKTRVTFTTMSVTSHKIHYIKYTLCSL